MTVYEVWDLPSRNLVGTYATKKKALAALRASLDSFGADYVADFMLGQEDANGRSKMVAAGSDLVALALAFEPEGTPTI